VFTTKFNGTDVSIVPNVSFVGNFVPL
jgi:hypothetical protein